jgi:predicted N-acyltransferase
MPMVALNIDYPDFQTFMSRVLSYKTRKDLNVKFRRAAAAGPIEMTVVRDITPFVDEVYPLYLQVYERAELHFEKLTPEYLCRLGREMPDKTVFFIWRHQGRTVAFSMCMLENNEMYGEYLGFDYTVALDLHLYHVVIRDVITWAMAHGCKTLRSSEGGYDPKRHLRFDLAPVDLYVRAGSRVMNFMLSKLLPYMVPVSYDPVLRRFPNYDKVWND